MVVKPFVKGKKSKLIWIVGGLAIAGVAFLVLKKGKTGIGAIDKLSGAKSKPAPALTEHPASIPKAVASYAWSGYGGWDPDVHEA
jgi:hypothetical protein